MARSMRFGFALAAATLAILIAADAALAQTAFDDPAESGTFSVIGRDPATGELGVAVHSKTISVGSRVRGGKGGVAVFAHQSGSNPLYSRIGVELLEAGWTPQEALDFMVRGDSLRNNRQVAVLDIQGRSAAWTSPTITDWKGHRCGVDYCAQGNTLTGPEVVEAMANAMEASRGNGPLAERLVDALLAGEEAGGDWRGVQSAGVLILHPRAIADYGDWRLDLRVDEHRQPIRELRRILDVTRASDLLAEANTRMTANDHAGALELANAALAKAPDYDNVFFALAHIHLTAGRRPEGLQALRRAIELNPYTRLRVARDARFAPFRSDPEVVRILSET